MSPVSASSLRLSSSMSLRLARVATTKRLRRGSMPKTLLTAVLTPSSWSYETWLEIRRPLSIQRLGTEGNPNMSSAVVHGGILTTMGVVDTEGKTIEEQTQNILDKIHSLLKEGGTDRSKLLTANIWLKDIGSDFSKMNAIWVKWIHADNKPIRACVEANLAFPSLLVEIQVTAAV